MRIDALWADETYRPRMLAALRIRWDADMLAALRAGIAAGKSWAAIGRIIGVTPHSAWDEAFRRGWTPMPSGSSRFGAAWRKQSG
jgi:hypothetical protein